LFSGKTIFIAALDWGLGHATRCVPVIRQLEKENKIILGITPLTRTIFDKEFPLLEKVNIPAYNIRYSAVLPLWMKLLSDAPRLLSVIKKEHRLLNNIIHEKKIDVIISDNRFGMYSKKIHSVFITHQLFLKAPLGAHLFQKKNRIYLLNFNEIWVPDHENEEISLSGELSHGTHFHKNVKYIGPKSRLEKVTAEKKYDHLFLISGPQPQQKFFIDQCLTFATKNPALKYAMVTPSGNPTINRSIDHYINPGPGELSKLICGSRMIICRSGYSTLMDLHLLEKKELILVPTPGQTEQEYLATLWQEKFGAYVCKQQQLHKLKL
jgi:hypothetical protein